MADKRFARVSSDPRFKKVDRKRRKVKIDSRFERMFHDKTFTTKHFVDKRGAVIGKTSKEDLRQFYDLSDEEKEEEPKSSQPKKSSKKEKSQRKESGKKLRKKKKGQPSVVKNALAREDSDGNRDDIKNEDNLINTAASSDEAQTSEEEEENGNYLKIDLARGEGNLDSSSSSEDDDDDDDDINDNDEDENGEDNTESSNCTHDIYKENNKNGGYESDTDDETEFQDDELDHQWAELDSNIHKSSNTTSRLAVCNLDWDKINATDLFVVFSSLRSKGIVKSVKIYPSEYGLERLKNEECYGPEELRGQENDDHNKNNVEGSSFSREKLRQYQINRLKYYYAVVECDSAETSNHIYEEFDGVEFELSGNLLDLRFIPDDMEFEHEPVSVAKEMPTQATYKPPEFETTALHQTNVKLTWDETDTKRIKTTMRAFSKDDLQNMDFEAYLASSGEEETLNHEVGESDNSHSENEEDRIAKYKKLVQEIDSKEHEDDNDNEMEITWEPGLKESALNLVAKKQKEKEEKKLTAWDKYLNKKKEKRRERRAKEKAQKLDKSKIEQDEDEDDIPEGVDMSDPFFNQDFGPDFPADNNKRVKSKKDIRKKGKKHSLETEEEKKQKEELELLLMDEKEEPQHFSLKGIMENEKKKKKRKKRRKEEHQTKEDDFTVDVDDPRFSALYSSHLYAIDPSDPQFKKTKAMDVIFEERHRRRTKSKQSDELEQKSTHSKDEKTTTDPSLSLLVKSVKSKTGEFNQRRKKRKNAH